MGNKINIYDSVLENLSMELRDPLSKIPHDLKGVIEEIRIRKGSPLIISSGEEDYFIDKKGKSSLDYKNGFIVEEDHIKKTFQLITNYSVYAYQEELRNGFITIRGGHRVGVGGKVIYGNEGLETIRDVSSLNIRIAREKLNISNHIIPYLVAYPRTFYNTLIISSPQCGKTTLLRDLVRNLSNGIPELKGRGFKIGLVDERSEIAGIYRGMPQKDIGLRTDILDGCLKSDE